MQICRNVKSCLLGKIRKNIVNLLLTEFAHRVDNVKIMTRSNLEEQFYSIIKIKTQLTICLPAGIKFVILHVITDV